MKDLNIKLWLGLPLSSFLFCLIVSFFGADTYWRWISASESAYAEYSTVAFLIPAVLLSGWMVWRRKDFPNRWLGVWVLLLFLGSLYYLGEESSWGQHYFHWATPDWLAEVSDQGETNIHNIHGIFDQFPRGLLTAAAIAGFVLPPFLVKRRKEWDPAREVHEWFWPTMACFPSGLLVALVALPQKIYGKYLPLRDPDIPEWFDAMFLRGKHNELMEHFLAMFIMMYVCSLFYRFRKFRKMRTVENEQISNPRSPEQTENRRPSLSADVEIHRDSQANDLPAADLLSTGELDAGRVNVYLLAFSRSRVIVSRLFGLILIFFILFTTHSWPQSAWIDILFEVLGLFLLSVCSLGRLWALLYVSGYKSSQLVTEGPYSMVRHPLYFFSLIGAIGIGFASENLLVLGAVVLFYFLYYPLTILAEEKKLTRRFGNAYLEYMKIAPRFIPKLSLLKEAKMYKINASKYFHNFIDGIWFIWIFILLHFVESLQEMGILPVLFTIP